VNPEMGRMGAEDPSTAFSAAPLGPLETTAQVAWLLKKHEPAQIQFSVNVRYGPEGHVRRSRIWSQDWN
jgi:hypothetical protein